MSSRPDNNSVFLKLELSPKLISIPVVPAILVMAFVLANKSDYYASDMCWIEWKHIWLFIGPAITIIAVSPVLLFLSKMYHCISMLYESLFF